MYFIGNDKLDRLFGGVENVTTETAYPLTSPTPAKVVHIKHRDKDSYGEYYQGDDEVYMILEIDGRYYKKTGSQSSYGWEITWDSGMTEVNPIVKTIQVWE